MKTAIIAMLWAASLWCAYCAGHIISKRFDYAAPAAVKTVISKWSGVQVPTNDWSRDPRMRQFGRFVLSRPRNPQQAGLLVGIIGYPRGPVILVSEGAKSGQPEGFSFYDAAGNMITVQDKNGDGIFDVLSLQTTNGVYVDRGLSGTFIAGQKSRN